MLSRLVRWGRCKASKEDDLLEVKKRLSLRVLPWRNLLVSAGQTHRDDGQGLLRVGKTLSSSLKELWSF